MRRTVALVIVGFGLVLGGGARADGNAVSVSISNQAYTPIIATVRPGGTVTWVNDDSETHSVFIDALGADHLIAPGSGYSYTFGDAGEYTYHCSLHSHAGKVVVAVPPATSTPPPPPPTAATTVPTTVATTVATTTPTTVVTTVATTAAPATTAPATTEPPTTTAVVLESDPTLAPLVVVRIDDGGGGGVPSGALVGGAGGGAALGVGAGFLIKRRVSKRTAG